MGDADQTPWLDRRAAIVFGAGALFAPGALRRAWAQPGRRIGELLDENPQLLITSDSARASFPALDAELAREVVLRSHLDAAAVNEVLQDRPDLAKSAVDWGFGDWESAIDAASHSGKRDVVELLVACGARATIFTAAMMGWTDVVRGAIVADPVQASRRGPHGISLLEHARAGGDEAAETFEYLWNVPDSDVELSSRPLFARALRRYLGEYRFGPGDGDRIVVRRRAGGGLEIGPPGGPMQAMRFMGDDVFRPIGSIGVTLHFSPSGDPGLATALMVKAPDVIGFLRAIR